MPNPEIVRESVGGVWETNVATGGGGGGSVSEITSNDNSVTITDPTGPTVDLSVSGGSQPGAVIGTRATVGFADLADQGGGLGRSPVIYTLQPGEQILFVLTRVTEAFDDGSMDAIFVSTAAVGPFGNAVGIPSGRLNGSQAADGFVNVLAALGSPGSGGWASASIRDPQEVETVATALYVFGSSMSFDGATGIVEFTLYTCTPVSA